MTSEVPRKATFSVDRGCLVEGGIPDRATTLVGPVSRCLYLGKTSLDDVFNLLKVVGVVKGDAKSAQIVHVGDDLLHCLVLLASLRLPSQNSFASRCGRLGFASCRAPLAPVEDLVFDLGFLEFRDKNLPGTLSELFVGKISAVVVISDELLNGAILSWLGERCHDVDVSENILVDKRLGT